MDAIILLIITITLAALMYNFCSVLYERGLAWKYTGAVCVMTIIIPVVCFVLWGTV